ncbi:MAG: isocitrate dehydrogenase (NADP(+)) [Firmicutes bacterium]|nr:isocitrate dehydrogenase (NADP(+)) [Bacillota bacterium]
MVKRLAAPDSGSAISRQDNSLQVPADPIIPFIEGDGSGPDLWRATRKVLDAAVEKAYHGRRRITWLEVLAGEKAFQQTGQWLPDETIEAISHYLVAIKGPLNTPVGGGIRSINVALRNRLDLFATVRPVRWLPGVPSPVKHPEKVDMVVFRENLEDLYMGLEWERHSPEAAGLRSFFRETLGINIREDAGLGVKVISEYGSKRLIDRALRYAVERGRKSVTLVHKGNIMKYTDGAFRDWGYELAAAGYSEYTIAEKEALEKGNPEGRIIIKDRIGDNMFQQVLLRPEEYDVLACPNLIGDYLSDALAAQVGGLGVAPGANIGERHALFEASHGTAPKYAGLDLINPTSLILSGEMLLRHLGWGEAAALLRQGLEETLRERTMTQDLARQMEGARAVKTSEFAQRLVENMG